MSAYIKKSIFTIIRIFIVYRPFPVFMWTGILLMFCGFLFLLRFLIIYLIDGTAGHIQSVRFGGVLLVIGVQVVSLAFIADLTSVNRKLLEKVKTLSFQNFLLSRESKDKK